MTRERRVTKTSKNVLDKFEARKPAGRAKSKAKEAEAEVRHLPFKDSAWNIPWEKLQENWLEILMEVLSLDRQACSHDPATPVIDQARRREDDHWLFSENHPILDGSRAEVCSLPMKLADRINFFGDDILYVLDAFSDYKNQLLERERKAAMRKKAVESLQPWQKEALELD